MKSFAIFLILASAASPRVYHDESTEGLVTRAGQYVLEYEQQFSAIVCEEQQTQRIIRPDGTERRRRTLVSDLLLVKTGDRTVGFRDVISVDGKTVRDRQERLQKLFVDSSPTAFRQARAIAEESSRYNIGFSRTVDALMVPLEILHPRSAGGFRFAKTKDGLSFEEFRSPSLIRYRSGQRIQDMLLRGRLTLDANHAGLLGASLAARNDVFDAAFDLRYVEDTRVGLLVPAEMQERYSRTAKPKEDHLEVSSSYGNFRRFQVIVNERIEEPR